MSAREDILTAAEANGWNVVSKRDDLIMLERVDGLVNVTMNRSGHVVGASQHHADGLLKSKVNQRDKGKVATVTAWLSEPIPAEEPKADTFTEQLREELAKDERLAPVTRMSATKAGRERTADRLMSAIPDVVRKPVKRTPQTKVKHGPVKVVTDNRRANFAYMAMQAKTPKLRAFWQRKADALA